MSKIGILSLAVLTFVIGHSVFVISANASVRTEPAVIDVQAFPRETPYFTVSVVNETSSRVTYYPLVGEFDSVKGTVETPGSPYQAATLVAANLEIDREEISVAPGASRSLTGKINISSKLPPGTYHAIVAFVPEFPQGGQQNLRLDGAVPRVLLNITVLDDAKERLNLVSFSPVRKVFLRPPAKLVARIENGGNVPTTPTIETRFFDRTDQERGSVTSAAPDGAIGAEQSRDVAVTWNEPDAFGRYRALISVSYGTGIKSQVLTASATFWVLPLWLICVLALGLIILSYGAARIIVRSSRRRHA